MRPSGTFRTDYGRDMALVQTKTQWSLLAAFLVFIALLPLLLDAVWLTWVNFTLITLVAVMGLNVVTGMAGQFNLGQAALVLVGGYASGILSKEAGLPFLATLPLSCIIAGLAGVLVGFSSLRMTGFYLGIATFAFHELVVFGIRHGGDFTGGVWGLSGLPDPSIGGVPLDTDTRMFYVILLAAVAAVVFTVNLGRSRVGRAFEGIKQNWMAAQSMGVNVYRYKLLAFFIGSALAGLAGCLLVGYLGFASFEMVTIMDSIWYLGMMIVGGWGSVLGAILGVVGLELVKQVISMHGLSIASTIAFLPFERISSLVVVVYGLLIVLFLSFRPHGLVSVWNTFKTRYRQWPL